MILKSLPKCVIFDLDGTLLDNSSVVADAYYTGMEQLGYEPREKSFIKTLFGKSTFDTGRGLGIREEDLSKIDTHFWEYFGSYAQSLEGSPVVYDSVPQVLNFFHKQNIPIGICTSNQASSARILIDKAGLSQFISAYVGSEDLEARKPSPEPIYLALSRLGISSPDGRDESLWFIGDSPPDIGAAKNAGIVSIGVPDAINYDAVKDTKPDFIFPSMSELFKAISTL